MGMFDRVWVVCPRCGAKNELQSKAGSCSLDDYTIYSAPPSIIGDLADETFTCRGCKGEFQLKVQYMASVIPYQPEEEESDEWDT